MENEGPVPQTSEVEKKLRLTYSREFLLSLGELDVCKKLPNGFNEAILSEFGGLSSQNYDRQKNVGSFRGEYPSQDCIKVYMTYQSRWKTRSTGSSDKDADSQSDRDSVSQVSADPGRRFGNQTRRWENPKNAEHDGLLGSGVFPRPPGFTAPRYRGNGSYQLNKTTEPYQPPRPYKAVPYSRKDHTDSCNDETFGSAECSSEDRAEEEKIRRANFESMRRDQQKIHQDKQKQSGINRKANIDPDMAALLGNPLDEKSQTDSSTSTSHIHTAAPRPLVPPGFSGALAEKKLPVQSSSVPLPSEAGNAAFGDKISKAFSQPSMHAAGKLMAPLSTEISEQKVDCGNRFGKEAAQEANELWEDDIVIMNDSSCKNDPKLDVKDMGDLDHSTTVIEKLFSSALSKRVSGSAYGLEHQIVKAEKEILGPAIIESMKFSHKEKKLEGDHSLKEVLSLMVNKEKETEDIVDSFITPQILPTPGPSFLFDVFSEAQSVNTNKISSCSVLTCEDLEQSILADVKENNENVHEYETNLEKKSETIDDCASNHLLSLLHKGTETSRNEDNRNCSEQSLTLESLFGASFMNALHSAEAPVSARTGGMEYDEVAEEENDSRYTLLAENGNVEAQNALLLNAIFPERSSHIQKGPLEMIDPNEIYRHVHSQITQSQYFDNVRNRNPQMKFGAQQHHQNVYGKNGGDRYDDPHHLMLQQQHMQIPPHYEPMRGYTRLPGYSPEMLHSASLPGYGTRLPGPPPALRLFELEMQARNQQQQQMSSSHFHGAHLPENMNNIRYR